MKPLKALTASILMVTELCIQFYLFSKKGKDVPVAVLDVIHDQMDEYY